MPWTEFWDMHSGGSQKLEHHYIYIEAVEEDALLIFYNRFGRDPHYTTCQCCGPDYNIQEYETLQKATAYQRGCRTLKRKWGDIIPTEFLRYYEGDEEPPAGYEFDRTWTEWKPLEEYMQSGEACFIFKEEIKPEEREGEIPVVWWWDD